MEVSTEQLLRHAFALELARARAVVGVGAVGSLAVPATSESVPTADSAAPERHVNELDRRLEPILAALGERNSQLPTHMLAKRYLLTQLDYLVLMLAIDNTRVHEPRPRPHRVSAVATVALPGLNQGDVRNVFGRLAVVLERLVLLTDDDDPAFVAGQAVCELVGL